MDLFIPEETLPFIAIAEPALSGSATSSSFIGPEVIDVDLGTRTEARGSDVSLSYSLPFTEIALEFDIRISRSATHQYTFAVARDPQRHPTEIHNAAWSVAATKLVNLLRNSILRTTRALIEEIGTLDDGGITLEYRDRSGVRELSFVIPVDGGIRYFVATGPGVRYAGIVREDDAVAQLARWAETAGPFPARGLEIGRSSLPS